MYQLKDKGKRAKQREVLVTMEPIIARGGIAQVLSEVIDAAGVLWGGPYLFRTNEW